MKKIFLYQLITLKLTNSLKVGQNGQKKINIFGPSGCGKTHLTNILSKKLKLLLINANKFDGKINNLIENMIV